ncbi:MAG: TetR family transcriptional regulator C-terminal domain-containing protein [Thiogranum sp.]|nr:TetR family transcriptional regulator C-terminal domain-containing protein [Thiogranum sp.]
MITESGTRQRIIASARDLIYSRSYADVGVAEICERAAVKKGSFYHFFPSKQELSLAVIDDMRVLMEDRILIPAFARDLPPLQRLQRFADNLYAYQRDTSATGGRLLGCPFGNLALEMATGDDSIRRKLESVFAGIQARLEHVLEEALASGEIDAGVDLPATAQAMLAYFEGVLMMAKTANDPELIRKLAPAFTRIRIPHVTS